MPAPAVTEIQQAISLLPSPPLVSGTALSASSPCTDNPLPVPDLHLPACPSEAECARLMPSSAASLLAGHIVSRRRLPASCLHKVCQGLAELHRIATDAHFGAVVPLNSAWLQSSLSPLLDGFGLRRLPLHRATVCPMLVDAWFRLACNFSETVTVAPSWDFSPAPLRPALPLSEGRPNNQAPWMAEPTDGCRHRAGSHSLAQIAQLWRRRHACGHAGPPGQMVTSRD